MKVSSTCSGAVSVSGCAARPVEGRASGKDTAGSGAEEAVERAEEVDAGAEEAGTTDEQEVSSMITVKGRMAIMTRSFR